MSRSQRLTYFRNTPPYQSRARIEWRKRVIVPALSPGDALYQAIVGSSAGDCPYNFT
jgi:hypothetical protein